MFKKLTDRTISINADGEVKLGKGIGLADAITIGLSVGLGVAFSAAFISYDAIRSNTANAISDTNVNLCKLIMESSKQQ